MGELIFSFMRHRYFMALTNKRLLIMARPGCTSRFRASSRRWSD